MIYRTVFQIKPFRSDLFLFQTNKKITEFTLVKSTQQIMCDVYFKYKYVRLNLNTILNKYIYTYKYIHKVFHGNLTNAIFFFSTGHIYLFFIFY